MVLPVSSRMSPKLTSMSLTSKSASPAKYRSSNWNIPARIYMHIFRLASKGYCHCTHAQFVRLYSLGFEGRGILWVSQDLHISTRGQIHSPHSSQRMHTNLSISAYTGSWSPALPISLFQGRIQRDQQTL